MTVRTAPERAASQLDYSHQKIHEQRHVRQSEYPDADIYETILCHQKPLHFGRLFMRYRSIGSIISIRGTIYRTTCICATTGADGAGTVSVDTGLPFSFGS